jgi:hypothetical protein
MYLYLVVGGDSLNNRVDAIGTYTTLEAAEQAAFDAGCLIRDGQWFGCSICCIQVDTPMRKAWSAIDRFTGWRSLPEKTSA